MKKLAPWEPANNGTGKRIWFLTRRDESLPVADRFRFTSRGQLVKYKSFETAQKAADELNATVKVSYRIVIEWDKGTMSGPSLLRDDDGNPLPEYDLSELNPQLWGQGYPSAELAREQFPAVHEYVRDRARAGGPKGSGSYYIEKITETIKREKIDV
jgi:hypothetical protein